MGRLSPLTYKIAFKTSVIYFIIGVVYIVVSDRYLSIDWSYAEYLIHFQTIKGIAFVTVTAFGLFFLIRFYTNAIFNLSESQMQHQAFEEKYNAISQDELKLNELAFEQTFAGIFFNMLDEPVFWNDNIDKSKILEYIMSHCRYSKGNAAMMAQYGATEDQLIGQPLIEQLKYEPDKGYRIIRRILEERNITTITRERKIDGTEILIEANYACLFDELGRVTGIFGIQQDVTQRINTEQKLRESEDRFKRLAEMAPIGLIISDINQIPIYISPNITVMTGYTADDFEDMKAWFETAYPDAELRQKVQMTWDAIYEKARKHEKTESINFPVVCKDGITKHLEFRISCDESFNYVTFNDITLLIRNEEKSLNELLTTENSLKRNISMAIHDGLQQTLASAYINFNSIKSEVTRLESKYSERFLQAVELLNEGLIETRKIAEHLMPRSVKDFGLTSSLDAIILQAGSDIKIDFIENIKDERFDDNIENGLFQIVKAALDFVKKHTDAKSVHIQLIKHEDRLNLTLEDDRKALDLMNEDVHLAYEGTVALMRNRVYSLGGTLEISSPRDPASYKMIEIPLK